MIVRSTRYLFLAIVQPTTAEASFSPLISSPAPSGRATDPPEISITRHPDVFRKNMEKIKARSPPVCTPDRKQQ